MWTLRPSLLTHRSSSEFYRNALIEHCSMKIYKVEEENISEYNQKLFFKLVPISSSTVGCFGKRSTGALGDGLDLLTWQGL